MSIFSRGTLFSWCGQKNTCPDRKFHRPALKKNRLGRPKKSERIGWTYPADRACPQALPAPAMAMVRHDICADLRQSGVRSGQQVNGVAPDGFRLQPTTSQWQRHPLHFQTNASSAVAVSRLLMGILNGNAKHCGSRRALAYIAATT
ncbi:hypothetical protein [Mesorhizobium sp. M0910]|uniref:hypothetical protein n=1 Tax=Mesorhizobium sp. M0910 TaxID=2957025 RepID=UPI00333CBDFA